MDVKGKKISIMGLGESGKAAVRTLTGLGAEVFVSDSRPREKFSGFLNQYRIEGEFDAHTPELYRHKDLVMISPGVPFDLPLLQEARKNGVEVVGELELAYRLCPAPLIAVTASKGKSTTCSLIHQLLRAHNFNAFLAGNIGIPFIGELEKAKTADMVILEVSSFQLEGIKEFRPKISAFLNFFPDHLDRHTDLEDYFNAKMRLFSRQTGADLAVLNLEEPRLKEIPKLIAPRISWYQLEEAAGLSAFYRRNRFVLRMDGKELEIAAEYLPLEGEHNLKNILAALLISRLAGADLSRASEVLQSFSPLHHRLETIGTCHGVRYVNDSKSTTPHSSRAGLLSFPARRVILLTGGKDKGIEVEPLAQAVSQWAKGVILFGDLSAKLSEAVRAHNYQEISYAGDLAQAVDKAKDLAREGDVVLFSPCGSSFDMFNNAEERGEVFIKTVKERAS